ncbi:MAG: hypothetical protein ACJ74O_07305 [Frankiaceae bacterium]
MSSDEGDSTAKKEGAEQGAAAPSSKAPQDKRAAQELFRDTPRELTDGAGPPPEVATGEGAGDLGAPTFSKLLTFHPFSSFFFWLAEHQYPSGEKYEFPARRLRERNKWFYWICVALDTFITLIAALLLLLFATAVLYKAIWLTPDGKSLPPRQVTGMA